MKHNKFVQAAIILIGVVALLGGYAINESVKLQRDNFAMINEMLVLEASAAARLHKDVRDLQDYVIDLEERITGERALLTEQLEEERRQRQLLAREVAEAASSGTPEISSIVSEWEERVVRLECDFGFSTVTGSGLLMRGTDFRGNSRVQVVTNRHVVADDLGRGASECRVQVNGDSLVHKVSSDTRDIEISVEGLDFGLLNLSTSSARVESIVSKSLNHCLADARTGEGIVILGYPGIGSRDDITATEGIVSGREGNFYITSAKVERGNSGGAAIHVENNCYLGIPTFVTAGGIESLARILDVDVLGIK